MPAPAESLFSGEYNQRRIIPRYAMKHYSCIVFHMSEMRLLDTEGRRLYLNAEERTAFLKAARAQDPVHCAFAELLFFTGCRISEALEVTPERIDLSDNHVNTT